MESFGNAEAVHQVSILVLMEVKRETAGIIRTIADRVVSILVLMEVKREPSPAITAGGHPGFQSLF